MTRWIVGAVVVVMVGILNATSWAQAQQAGALSEKTTITLGFAIGIGTLVLSAAGAFIGVRMAMVRVEQKLADHCDVQREDLAVLGGRMTEMEHCHRDCPARIRQ